MAEGQGSSSVEVDGPYSRAAYVEAPAIPHYLTLHEKTPAVQQIRNLYTQNGWPFRRWHMAFFYMVSKEDLAEFIGNPEAARNYGDTAELFATLFTAGRVPSTYKLPVNPAPPASAAQLAATMHSTYVDLAAEHKRNNFRTDVQNRDRKECVVTHKAKAFDQAHIVPFSVNSTGAGLDYVPPALAIAERFLGVSFRQEVQSYVGSLGGSDYPWNIITLTPFLHRMWDTYGLVGFRPRYIDAERGESGKIIYSATFTFHWLLDNDVSRLIPVAPLQLSADDCFQMVSESEEFSTQKERLFEMVYYPGKQPPNDLQRLEDGHVCRVRAYDRLEAEFMMKMLDLRWHASLLLCLAGGAEEDFLEHASDVDSDSDGYRGYPQGTWNSDDEAA